MSVQKLTLLRLQKQQKKLNDEPISNILVTRKGLLNFHFCIYGLEQEQYKNGYYHGLLQLHQQYPFSPPKLIFYTPSGRFQREKQICTTFTNFHKETWTSAWNVRTMLIATLSFMLEQSNGLGSINQGYGKRRKYAQESLKWNYQNNVEGFRQMFQAKIDKLTGNKGNSKQMQQGNSPKSIENITSNKFKN